MSVGVGVHGWLERLPWEDYRIPAHFWKRIVPVKGYDCWRWIGRKDVNARLALVLRLRRDIKREDILAIVPTCGFIDCVNPAHTCLTLVNDR